MTTSVFVLTNQQFASLRSARQRVMRSRWVANESVAYAERLCLHGFLGLCR
jgi:hypothetical protein